MARRASAGIWTCAALALLGLAASGAVVGAEGKPPALSLGAWLPHWKKDAGAERFAAQVARFSSISPFAFRVRSAERIDDTPRIGRAPWPALMALARSHGVKVLPSLVWADRDARAAVLGDDAARARHLSAILTLVEAHGFDGVDLDYERKLSAEGAGFSQLVRDLSRALHGRGKVLSCTIEPRVSARPPPGVRGRRASPWVDDYAVLGEACDAIRVMAYDQWAIAAAGHGGAHHASRDWVRAVLAYSSSALPKHKLHLGIPTYGWELRERGAGVEKVRALGFGQFRAQLANLGLRAERAAGGELIARRGRRLFVMVDAESIAGLRALAAEAGIAGVVLFKLDGQTDPAIWSQM